MLMIKYRVFTASKFDIIKKNSHIYKTNLLIHSEMTMAIGTNRFFVIKEFP